MARRSRGIQVVADEPETNPKADRLRESYTRLNRTSQPLDEKIAKLYQPTFKVPITALTGKIKTHYLYRVQSAIQIMEDKLVKVSVYTITNTKFNVPEDETVVLDIAKQDVQREVIYQELAGHIEGAPFSVPKIFRFNCYEEDGKIITLVEMQYIVSGIRRPTIAELKMVNGILTKNGIFHNDLVIDGNYIGEFGRELYNTGNIIVDADGRLWVIDFGSASDVLDKPRGGRKSRKRKSFSRKRRTELNNLMFRYGLPLFTKSR